MGKIGRNVPISYEKIKYFAQKAVKKCWYVIQFDYHYLIFQGDISWQKK